MLNTKRDETEIHHRYNEEEYAKKKEKHQRKRKPLKPSKEAVSLVALFKVQFAEIS